MMAISFVKYLTIRKEHIPKFDKLILRDVVGFVNMTQGENVKNLNKIIILLFSLASGP